MLTKTVAPLTVVRRDGHSALLHHDNASLISDLEKQTSLGIEVSQEAINLIDVQNDLVVARAPVLDHVVDHLGRNPTLGLPSFAVMCGVHDAVSFV
ncbi:hypothetical protein [Crenobacter intestini]|uniref:hypothetical protein n=1 Tax=Crenobacter intestini TaxID=2563443 RepID=UPI00196ABBFE|nr:hypothetical protein [Crenobacter intestini]